MDEKIIVSVKCWVYNHEKYLRDCLEGFVRQKTNFRYEVVVHDDASTDGSVEIIKEYTAKYPNIIKSILQKENQYSKPGYGSMDRDMNAQLKGKYIAICEGDDYWVDPYKLQKQVDMLEADAQCSMCCSDAVIISNTGISHLGCQCEDSRYLTLDEIVIGGGLYIPTASLVFRKEIVFDEDYVKCTGNCHVGDYPLQIFAAIKGKVYRFAEKQVAYRFEMGNSWTKMLSRQAIEKKISGWRSEFDMLDRMDAYSNFRNTRAFRKRKYKFHYSILKSHKKNFKQIYSTFKDINKVYPLHRRIKLFMLRLQSV